MPKRIKIMAAKTLAALTILSIMFIVVAYLGWSAFHADPSDLLPAAIAVVATLLFVLNWLATLTVVADIIHRVQRPDLYPSE